MRIFLILTAPAMVSPSLADAPAAYPPLIPFTVFSWSLIVHLFSIVLKYCKSDVCVRMILPRDV